MGGENTVRNEMLINTGLILILKEYITSKTHTKHFNSCFVNSIEVTQQTHNGAAINFSFTIYYEIFIQKHIV